MGYKVRNKAEKEQNRVRDGAEDNEDEIKEKFGEIDFFQKCIQPEYSENDGRSTSTHESSFRHLSRRVDTFKLNYIIYHITYIIFVHAQGVAGVDGQPLKLAFWTAVESAYLLILQTRVSAKA